MSVLEIPIGQKVYKIDCREEESANLQEFATKLNMLINSKAVDLHMRVDNDYLLLLVCLDLLQENSMLSEKDSAAPVAGSVPADSGEQLQLLEDTNSKLAANDGCQLSREEQQQISKLINLLTSQLE